MSFLRFLLPPARLIPAIPMAFAAGSLVLLGFAFPYGLPFAGYDELLVRDDNKLADIAPILFRRNVWFLLGAVAATTLLIWWLERTMRTRRDEVRDVVGVIALAVVGLVIRYTTGVGDLARDQDHASRLAVATALVHGPVEFGAFLLLPCGVLCRLLWGRSLSPWAPLRLMTIGVVMLAGAAVTEVYETPKQVDDLCSGPQPACRTGSPAVVGVGHDRLLGSRAIALRNR